LVWDLENQDKKPYRLLGHKSLVNDVAVTSNGLQIASASSDQTVRLWSYDGSSDSFISYSTKNNSAPVKSVDFSCDSKMLVTGSDDKTVKLFNVGDKKLVASMISHTNWVKCVRFSMDARLIASCSDDKTVKFWDVEKKKLNYTISDYHAGVVNSVRFHPDNSLIGSACFDKKLRLFDIRSKTLVQVYDEHKKPVTSLAFHPHGIYLASTCYDELVRIFDIRSGKILYTLSGHQGATTAVNFSHYGDLIATGAQEGLVTLWNSNLNEEAEERDFYYFPLENDPNVIKSSSDERRDNLQISYFESSIKNLSLKDNTNMVVSKKSNIKSGILSQPPQNTQDSVTEELAKVFEKMVYQLELITK
jgi:centriolar protein POC1